MLEVQLVVRGAGTDVPVACSDSPVLVKHVARAMLREMESWRWNDRVLDGLAAEERRKFLGMMRVVGVRLEKDTKGDAVDDN